MMRPVLVGAVLVLTLGGGALALRAATHYRDDAGPPGEHSVVTFTVQTRVYGHSDLVAAGVLWQQCVSQLDWQQSTQPVQLAGGDFRATLRPSLGPDGRRRLRGCLDDATVARIEGHVVSAVTVPG